MWPVNSRTRSFLLEIRSKLLPHKLGQVRVNSATLGEKSMGIG